jgi:hypothetical protein
MVLERAFPLFRCSRRCGRPGGCTTASTLNDQHAGCGLGTEAALVPFVNEVTWRWVVRITRLPHPVVGPQVGSTLTYSPAVLPSGVTSPGENGLIATVINAAVNSSVTNFATDATQCTP